MKLLRKINCKIEYIIMKMEVACAEGMRGRKPVLICSAIMNKLKECRRNQVLKNMFTVPIPYKDREVKSIYELPYPQEVRRAALERAVREIYERNITGNVAEVGVFKGRFARHINWWFYDRKIYLVDTFKGFDVKDIKKEKELKYSDGSQDFSNTSADYVLACMPNKKNCIIKKGWFPEVMKGVTDEFCFVSLDADLYEPIYSGLMWFYPKLVRGGYIFVHDCCNVGYKGARQAVLDFVEKYQIGYVILPDEHGTAVITK